MESERNGAGGQGWLHGFCWQMAGQYEVRGGVTAME